MSELAERGGRKRVRHPRDEEREDREKIGEEMRRLKGFFLRCCSNVGW